jgi:hypothetical protein
MKPWIGNYPYAPQWDKIGDKIMIKGYPKDRHIMKSDYVFRILFQFLPLLILIMIIIMKY